MSGRKRSDPRYELMRAIQIRHPGFRRAVVADARITASYRGERADFRSRADTVLQIVRLCWTADAFAAQVLYRLKARLQRSEIPLLPRVAHRLAMMVSQVSIGDPVRIEPGVYLIHGQVVIDGLVEIGAGTVIGPWVTIGLRAGDIQGPTIERFVHIGTGTKVIGPVRIGARAQIGANSVVTRDVARGSVVIGAPARPIDSRS